MIQSILRWISRAFVVALLAMAVGVMVIRHVARDGARVFYVCGKPLHYKDNDYYLLLACDTRGELWAKWEKWFGNVRPMRFMGDDRWATDELLSDVDSWSPVEILPLEHPEWAWTFPRNAERRRFSFEHDRQSGDVTATVPYWSLALVLSIPALLWLLKFEMSIRANRAAETEEDMCGMRV